MTQLPMPRGKVGSPVAQLTEAITASSTYIPFNTSNLPDDVPNQCTVGTELLFESIWYTSKDAGGVYTTNGGIRGFDGTTARSWAQGTNVARYISEYDMYARKANIEDHETRIVEHSTILANHESRVDILEHPTYSIDRTTTEPVSLDFSSGAVGDNFEPVTGTLADWAIVGGKLRCVATGTAAKAIRLKGKILQSGVYQTKFKFGDGGQNFWFAFHASATPSATEGYAKTAYVVYVTPVTITISKDTAVGGWSNAKEYYAYTFAPGTEYTLKIVRNSITGQLDLYVNDVIQSKNLPVGGEVDGFTKYLNHCAYVNAPTVPSSGGTSVGGCAQTTAKSKFGRSSIYFDGTDDCYTMPDSDDWHFGAGDFTLDMWVYPTDQRAGGFIGQAADANNLFAFYEYARKLRFTAVVGGVTIAEFTSVELLTLNQWSHVEFCRTGNNGKLFINGVECTLEANTPFAADMPNIAQPLKIGVVWYGYYKGYIDEIRISKGIARHTATFTPMTRAYFGTPTPDLTYSDGYVTYGVLAAATYSTAGFEVDDLTITPTVPFVDTFATDSSARYVVGTGYAYSNGKIVATTPVQPNFELRSYVYGDPNVATEIIGKIKTTAITTGRIGSVGVYTGYYSGGLYIDDTQATNKIKLRITRANDTAWSSVTDVAESAFIPGLVIGGTYYVKLTHRGSGSNNLTLTVYDTNWLELATVTGTDTTYVRGPCGFRTGGATITAEFTELNVNGVEHPCGDPNLYRGVQNGFVDDLQVDTIQEYVKSTSWVYNTVDKTFDCNAKEKIVWVPVVCGLGTYEFVFNPVTMEAFAPDGLTNDYHSLGVYFCSDSLTLSISDGSPSVGNCYGVMIEARETFSNCNTFFTITNGVRSIIYNPGQGATIPSGLTYNSKMKIKVVITNATTNNCEWYMAAYGSNYTETPQFKTTISRTSGYFGISSRYMLNNGSVGLKVYKISYTTADGSVVTFGGVNHGARYDTTEHIDLTYKNPYKRGLTELELTSQTTYVTPALNGVKVGCLNVTDNTRVGEYPFDRLLEQSQSPIDDAILVDHNSDDVGDWITCSLTRNQPNTDNQPVTAITHMSMKTKWGDA